ncbi:TolC family protein [Mucilaginibacter robiniae]|uniref:TolC family protein n=1 Tax=Mucilaginibacter robiniae TaxID=2728022 RepID=A0A7L5E7L6_9SPHI|nr:TolC family protein [Mucilaginibacter robiniae]QJD97814.1 TolC family protein [Mucilaginibacter robiniae]
MKKKYFHYISIIVMFPLGLLAQTRRDTVSELLTLQQCVDFALRNQPAVKQALIDESINERDIRISLSAWLPQLSTADSYQRYFQRAATISSTGVGTTGSTTSTSGGTNTGNNGGTTNNNTGTGTGTGTNGTTGNTTNSQQQSVIAAARNVSSVALQATQVIYNNDVLLASRASKYSREYYRQNSYSAQINVVTDVSKAFFDVLLSQKQLNILNEDIARLQRSLKDAYTRYQAGVADKTDYKQATIALNNSLASRKQTLEAVNSRTAYLKQVMGFTPYQRLTLTYDSTKFEKEAVIDTNQRLEVNNRIEFRLLQTQKSLQNLNVSYYKYGFLPSLSAFGTYNLIYFNDRFTSLYNNAYPTSLAGLSLSLPIFQGTKRLQNLSKARLQVERADLDIVNARNQINTEYVQALANYKSNYSDYQLLKQNVALAKDVYNVISLQYREGIKAYLDVLNAQADLRTSELNYYNALFQLLSSKIDLQRALGTLPVR